MPDATTPDPVVDAVRVLAAADRSAVSAAIKSGAPGLWQSIFQEGHNVAYGQRHGDLAAANAKVTDLTTQVSTLTEQLTQARNGGTPDVQRIHTDYATQISGLKQTAEKRERDLLARLEGMSLATAKSQLQSHLVTMGVDPDYAGVLAEKPEITRRLRAKEDQGVTVLQDGTEIPVVSSNGKTPIQLLADELQGRVPPKFIVSKVDAGAGSTVAGGTGQGGGSMDASTTKVLDDIVAAKRKELDSQRSDRDAVQKNLQALGIQAPAAL